MNPNPRPKKPKPKAAHGKQSLSGQLRDIIRGWGLSAYALGRMAGVDPGVIQRFLTSQRDIRLETADRIAHALGLRLAELGTRRGKSKPEPTGPAPVPETSPEPE